jgi:asparagine synthetase B (glutamine-hydrolysing)
MEFYLHDGNLIQPKEWEKLISSMETSFDNLETNKERAKRKLKDLLEKAILNRATKEKFGIAFYGGIDSTLIAFLCKKHNLNFTCFTIGLENSSDIGQARLAAQKYNFDLKYKILTLDEFEIILKNTIKILGNSEIVWVSVGAVLNATINLAMKNNIKILFSGLGTEELFAGYQRHEESLQDNNFEALHKECWNGLKQMWQRDLLRDYKISKSYGIDLNTPFMDLEVIKTAMSISPIYKLNKDYSKPGQDIDNKKIILREIAEDFGLDKEFAWRRKKAAQYGSNFVNGIDKLAKKHGFKTKKEYLQSLA